MHFQSHKVQRWDSAVGAAAEFDLGDIGTIGQELIWAVISLGGAARIWARERGGWRIAFDQIIDRNLPATE